MIFCLSLAFSVLNSLTDESYELFNTPTALILTFHIKFLVQTILPV